MHLDLRKPKERRRGRTNNRVHEKNPRVVSAILAPVPVFKEVVLCYTCRMQASTATPVLDEILEPVTRCLTVDSARQLLGHRPKRKTRALIEKLARKCNEGALTPDERAEYETYVFAGEFVALLQAKARALLKQQRPS